MFIPNGHTWVNLKAGVCLEVRGAVKVSQSPIYRLVVVDVEGTWTTRVDKVAFTFNAGCYQLDGGGEMLRVEGRR